MDKPELIQHIISEQQYKQLCSKYLPYNDLAKDLFQDLLVIVMEYPEAKIKEIKCTSCFVIKIIKNMALSVTSPFYKKYRMPPKSELKNEINHTDFNYYELRQEATDIEQRIDKCQQAKDSLYWFDREVLNQYLNAGSLRELAKKTRISKSALHSSILKSKQIIKEKCQ